jgi:hypothetical protein
MKQVKIQSDYGINTYLIITKTDDGDVVLKIIGNEEMRIATSGSRFEYNTLWDILKALNQVIEAVDKEGNK